MAGAVLAVAVAVVSMSVGMLLSGFRPPSATGAAVVTAVAVVAAVVWWYHQPHTHQRQRARAPVVHSPAAARADARVLRRRQAVPTSIGAKRDAPRGVLASYALELLREQQRAHPDWTTFEAVRRSLMPMSANGKCALLDTLDSKTHSGKAVVGKANIFVSHAWCVRARDTVCALARARVCVCCLCVCCLCVCACVCLCG